MRTQRYTEKQSCKFETDGRKKLDVKAKKKRRKERRHPGTA